ncbi:uncharacterized mitochondrial protein-like protein [Tanacetum coccineum]
MDVKNAFLNSYLNEEVYMKPPPGIPHQLGEVCKLHKALYKLKQAPRAWYEKFSIVVTSLGFVSSNHDSALFVKRSSVGRILLSLYVDDMIITGDDYNGIKSLKAKLSHRFAMKDLDNMIAEIPIDAKAKYTPTDGNPLPDPSLYRTIVGSLIYLTVTQSDIAYVVHIVSQFVTTPTTVHWAIVLQILRYLRAEYRAMTITTSEIVWLRWLLADMGVHITSPTPLYCNNRRAIQITRNTVFHERTKHIEIDCHFTQHHLQAGTISLPFVPFALLVDIFTKPYCDLLSRFLSDKLSMFIVATL